MIAFGEIVTAMIGPRWITKQQPDGHFDVMTRTQQRKLVIGVRKEVADLIVKQMNCKNCGDVRLQLHSPVPGDTSGTTTGKEERMKQVITIDNGRLTQIVEDGRIVFAPGMGSTAGQVTTGGEVKPPEYESETATILRHKQTSLAWRYSNQAELTQDIIAKNFKTNRVFVKKLDGGKATLVQGTVASDATGITYVEQSDGSVVYETYLKDIKGQASSGRTNALPAYNDRAEMLNDLKAIGYQQLVNIDGKRAWPPEGQAGFGPADEYVTAANGGIISGRNPDGEIIIESFEQPKK